MLFNPITFIILSIYVVLLLFTFIWNFSNTLKKVNTLRVFLRLIVIPLSVCPKIKKRGKIYLFGTYLFPLKYPKPTKPIMHNTPIMAIKGMLDSGVEEFFSDTS